MVIRVGIVGLQPGRSWAALAHVPALQALPGDYAIAGVANSSLASAEAAAAASGIPRAFANVEDMARSPDIDLVAVTVKVPAHGPIVDAVLDAGKHLYCEWPIGNGLAEAEAMAAKARAKGVLAVAGTQARAAPVMRYVRDLVAEGYVGTVLSTTLIGTGMNWGPQIEAVNAYTLDRANGANMLTIPLGHTMAAVAEALGPVKALSATLATRRKEVLVVDTGEMWPMTAPDQVLVDGALESGAPISIHYRGGMPRGTGLLWEINGTDGDIRVTGMGGHAQFVPLTIEGATGDDEGLKPLEIPARYLAPEPLPMFVDNVAGIYAMIAADLRDGTRTAPSFDDAVATHRLCDAIERAAKEGRRVTV